MTHWTDRYLIDAEAGVVYGLAGKPIGRVIAGGYVAIHHRKLGQAMAHRVIWTRVHGPIPADMEINHINGIKSDNRLENLELVTPSENIRHAYRTGLRSAAGENNGRALLTNDQVRYIRKSEETTSTLARELGVNARVVREVRNGRRWSSVA